MQNEHSLKFSREERLPLKYRLLLNTLARIRYGRLEVQLPGGVKREFNGTENGPDARWVIRDRNALNRMFARGDIGFAEAYMDGEWESPRLLDLLMLLDLNREALHTVEKGRWFSRLADLVLHRIQNRNTRNGSRENISYHYDLGNDFYRLWLDETMTYSSAIFESESQDLPDAQRNKYQRLIDMLDIKASDHVLEIGSGWGGFAIQAAAQSGCKVTTVTLSSAQL